MHTLTSQDLRRVLSYDLQTGVFTWRAKPSPRLPAGAVAGTVTKFGYRHIKVGERYYKAHRLAWLYVNGVWPPEMVDHINGLRDDNRICNLRLADRSLNAQNQRKASKGKKSCDLLGVFPAHGRWISRLRVGDRLLNLGTFDTPERAYDQYVSCKRELHHGCTL